MYCAYQRKNLYCLSSILCAVCQRSRGFVRQQQHQRWIAYKLMSINPHHQKKRLVDGIFRIFASSYVFSLRVHGSFDSHTILSSLSWVFHLFEHISSLWGTLIVPIPKYIHDHITILYISATEKYQSHVAASQKSAHTKNASQCCVWWSVERASDFAGSKAKMRYVYLILCKNRSVYFSIV